jgi:hypothetical protein
MRPNAEATLGVDGHQFAQERQQLLRVQRFARETEMGVARQLTNGRRGVAGDQDGPQAGQPLKSGSSQ